MSPVIMDLPPAAVGHNSQAYEVRPVAQDSRAQTAKAAYLRMAVQDGISERDRILHHAAITMGHAEFHAFFLMMHHGSRNGDRVMVGQQRLADLMGCSERHVRRIMEELDGAWFDLREKQRDARCGKIPPHVMQPLVAELVERSKTAGQHIVVPTAIIPQHADRAPMSTRTLVSGSSRTPVSGSELMPEPRAGHPCPKNPREPDTGVRLTIRSEPYATALAPASTHTHTREELDHLRDRLREAGGSAINEAHPGLMILAEPIRWLNSGCDLEMDIVPAVQKTAAAARQRGAKIVSWLYFSEVVQEARDRRLLPMPKPDARAYTASREPWQVRKDEEAANKRRVDEAIKNFDWNSEKAQA